jgi:hypothetical protein
MSSDIQGVKGEFPISIIGQIIGVFVLVGVGIGLTGGVAISQLGSGNAILSGILILIVLILTLLFGPVISVITGLRTGDQYGRSNRSYLAGLIGSVTGYFVMIVIVLLILSAVLAIAIGDGGSGSTTAQSATTPALTSTSSASPSNSLPIREYILPIVAVAIPTGITGIGGVYFGGNKSSSNEDTTDNTLSADTISNLPWKYVGIAIIIIAVLASGVVIGPELLSTDPQPEDLELTGESSVTVTNVFVEARITNPTNADINTVVNIELVIDGSISATTQEVISVAPNGETSIRTVIATTDDLTSSEIDSAKNNDYTIRFIISGETVETYRP